MSLHSHVPQQSLRLSYFRLFGLLFLSLVFAAVLPRFSSASLESTQETNTADKSRKPDAVPGEILVRFRKNVAAIRIAQTQTLGLADGRQINLRVEMLGAPEIVEGLRLAHVAPEETANAINALKSRSDVAYAEPNYIRRKTTAPADPRYSDLWGLKNTGQSGGTAGADIKAEQAWDVTTGSRDIVVAVIDEGVDVNHQDLQANIWRNPGEVAGNGVDDDGNGYIDDVNGYDFFHNDGSVYDGPGTNPDGSAVDEHGTHVSGTIGAAGNNGLGVVGVNWQVSVMALKFLGPEGGSTADLLKALAYAKMMRDRWITSGGAQGANIRITNNSYGGGGYSQAESEAIAATGASGILFVAAAGNEAQDNNILGGYPASYDVPNIISVAATDRQDKLASFSNKGSRTVHLGAPGVSILSTTPGNTYSFFNGTSMASPHVAGAAALVVAAHPDFSVSRIRGALLFGGEPISSLAQTTTTGNRLSAAGALQNAAEVDTTAPSAIADLHISAQIERGVTLNWTAPGDDGTSGRARLYEIRFKDPATPAEFLLALKQPANSGSSEALSINVPYRHASGFFLIRTFDNAGNSSDSTINVTVSGSAADPYSIVTEAPTALSTGGQKLGMTFDDSTIGLALPFNFPYFEQTYSQVVVSTNGALYFGNGPGSNDSLSVKQALNGRSMIAGLWDDLDLRTCFRADSDIYRVAPDNDRVILRWQGVKFNEPSCTDAPPVPEAINFEIELHRDGTIQLRYGQNVSLYPVVGIGGGEPEGYAINSHTAAETPVNLTNAQTITFTLRNPPRVADLALSGSGSANFTQVGQDFTFNMTARNLGPAGVGTAVVTDTLPNNANFVSCTSSQGSCSAPVNGIVQIALGPLNSGSSATITVVVQPTLNSSSPFGHNASISGGLGDPNSSNNSASAFTQIIVPNSNPQTGLMGVGAGSNQSFAIRSDSYGLAWGANNYGQLGDGSISTKSLPVRINGVNPISVIDGGAAHTLALKPDGSVWAWGLNSSGQLGDGTTINRKVPAKVDGLTNIIKLSAGAAHNLVLRSDGTVWAWGSNSKGQLGDGTQLDRLVPAQIAGLSGIISIAAGYNHSLAVKNDGTVWAWGGNESGQLGDSTTITHTTPVQLPGLVNITAVFANDAFSFFGPNGLETVTFSVALQNDGSVWTWGHNWRGQLGDGTTNKRSTPGQVPGLTNVSGIAAGGFFVIALRTDGTVWSWGGNFDGELGDLTLIDHSTPAQVPFLAGIQSVAAGTQHSLALRQDGHLFAWGSYNSGQLGFGGTVGSRNFPWEVSTQVPDPLPIAIVSTPTFSPDGGTFFSSQNVTITSPSAAVGIDSILVGGQHNFARLSTGAVYGWGSNYLAQLGFVSEDLAKSVVKTPRLMTGFDNATSISLGGSHNLALMPDGSVWANGSNGQGELGVDTSSRVRPTLAPVPALSGVVAVAAGSSRSLALKPDGTVWAWGFGPINSDSNFTQITPVPVNGINNVSTIACGSAFYAIRNDGTLWAWGNNYQGILGDGTETARPTPVQVAGLNNVAAVASGLSHAVALKSDGTVWVWGNNTYGQLGLGNEFSNHLTAVQVPGINGIVAIAAGGYHNLALKSDGTVWAWGSNTDGQIGDGTNAQRRSPVAIGLSGVIAIRAGYEHSVARRADGTVLIWGKNDYGQVGDGTTDSQSSPLEMGQLTGGVTIHYTTNGNDPTEDDPTISSGASVLIAQNAVLKARAFKYGWTPSAVKTANFSISTNQIDQTAFFVRQHYLDFLNREPDAPGLQFWINNIDSCGADNQCHEVKRIDTSAAYFLSIEFQQTGYLVHRFYKASFGRRPLFSEFLADTQTIGNGVVVNSPGWEQLLENNKQAFADAWVARTVFTSIYDELDDAHFVDTLIANTGATFSSTDRNAFVNALTGHTRTRAQVLRDIAENQAFYNAEYNVAFVEMQYFGYLRRNPQDAPDNNLDGFNFWLNKLNEFGGDFRRAEMVKAFLASSEYRQRFSNP